MESTSPVGLRRKTMETETCPLQISLRTGLCSPQPWWEQNGAVRTRGSSEGLCRRAAPSSSHPPPTPRLLKLPSDATEPLWDSKLLPSGGVSARRAPPESPRVRHIEKGLKISHTAQVPQDHRSQGAAPGLLPAFPGGALRPPRALERERFGSPQVFHQVPTLLHPFSRGCASGWAALTPCSLSTPG